MLRGSLEGFALPDLFRLMSRSKKTGRLDVTRKAGRGQVYFRDGSIYYASSSLARAPLGQKLIAAGLLTESQLMKALDQNAVTGERVGDVLLGMEVINRDQLEAALKSQIEDAIFDLMRWELGQFSWEADVGVAVEVKLDLSVEDLIMEASRRLDEFEMIRRRVPSPNAVMVMSSSVVEGPDRISITPDEWRVLVHVDGERSVAEIADVAGLEVPQVMKVFHALVSTGLVELMSEGSVGDEESAAPEEEEAQPLPADPEARVPGAAPAPPGPPDEIEPEGRSSELSLEPHEGARDQDALGAAASEPAGDHFSAPDSRLFEAGEGALPETLNEWFADPVLPEDFDDQSPDELLVDEGEASSLLDDVLGPELQPDSGADEPDSGADEPVEGHPDAGSPLQGEAAEASVEEAPSVPSASRAEDPLEQPEEVFDPLLFEGPEVAPANGLQGEEDNRKRVEDDEKVTPGLIEKLIDGLKGL